MGTALKLTGALHTHLSGHQTSSHRHRKKEDSIAISPSDFARSERQASLGFAAAHFSGIQTPRGDGSWAQLGDLDAKESCGVEGERFIALGL